MLETLREEFGHNPESISSSGIASANEIQRALREEEEERRRFEEDRFIRLVTNCDFCAFYLCYQILNICTSRHYQEKIKSPSTNENENHYEKIY